MSIRSCSGLWNGQRRTKKTDQLVEHMSIITVLIDLKDWQYLPTLSLPNKRISMEADREATFPVNETNDPRCIEQPRPCSFLLIVPTCHVFTAHNHSLLIRCDHKRVVQDTGMFQHIAKFYNSQVDRYSYGRRLLGLRFRASPLRANPSP